MLAIAGGLTILAAGAAFAYFQTTDNSNPAAALAATLTAPSGGTQDGTATPTAIPIRWTSPSGYAPTGYTVLRCAGSGCTPASSPVVGGCSDVITPVVNATSCIDSDTALAAGTTYTYVVEALLDNWTSPVSATFTGSTTAIAKLVITTQPSPGQNIQAKGSGSFSVSVAMTDVSGFVASNDNSDSVTLAIGTNPSAGVLSCTNTGGLTVTVSSGVASFTGCAITRAGTGYTLTASSATSPSLAAPSNANAFNIIAGAASQLTFSTQPSSGQNIQAKGTGSFTASVTVQDQNGNTVTGDSGRSITLALGTNPTSGSVLSCTGGLSATDSSGAASFSNCAITLTGTGYTLTASSSGLTAPSNANSFNITAGAASKLVFTAQPSAGQQITAAAGDLGTLTVAVQDQSGNTVTGDSGRSVALAVASGPGSMSCTSGLSVSDSSGSASFTGCAITTAGTYTLQATSVGLTTATGNSFTIAAASASKLVFTAQPSAGQQITAAAGDLGTLTVAVQDQSGNTVTGDSGRSVALAVASGPGSMSCTSGLSVSDSSGSASFTGCAITTAGTYTLQATSVGLTTATGNSFTIVAGTPAGLSFSSVTPALGSPIPVTCTGTVGTSSFVCTLTSSLGSAVSYTAQVLLIDQFQNLVTNTGSGIQVSLSSNGVLQPTSPVTVANGSSASGSFSQSLGLGLVTVTAQATVNSQSVQAKLQG